MAPKEDFAEKAEPPLIEQIAAAFMAEGVGSGTAKAVAKTCMGYVAGKQSSNKVLEFLDAKARLQEVRDALTAAGLDTVDKCNAQLLAAIAYSSQSFLRDQDSFLHGVKASYAMFANMLQEHGVDRETTQKQFLTAACCGDVVDASFETKISASLNCFAVGFGANAPEPGAILKASCLGTLIFTRTEKIADRIDTVKAWAPKLDYTAKELPNKFLNYYNSVFAAADGREALHTAFIDRCVPKGKKINFNVFRARDKVEQAVLESFSHDPSVKTVPRDFGAWLAANGRITDGADEKFIATMRIRYTKLLNLADRGAFAATKVSAEKADAPALAQDVKDVAARLRALRLK